jgi:hypothetical protein
VFNVENRYGITMINDKILEQIREEMIREIVKGKGITNIEKHLRDYLKRLDAVELTKKYHCSLDEAIDTIEVLQHSDEVRKIITMLD